MLEFIDYARKTFKELPAERWTATSASGQTVQITEHKAGVDFGRGPWVKFKFTENGEEREMQGYRSWSKGDRIKFGPPGKMKECDHDDLEYTAAADLPGAKMLIILKFKFEQDDALYSYRFEGKSN